MQIISKNLSHLRQLRGLSQEEIAEDLGITRAKQGSYEEGRANPPIPMLIKYADYFKLPIDILLRNDLAKSDEEPSIIVGKNRILFPMAVDKEAADVIEVVPIKATAGYLNGYGDPEYVESLQHMKLPFMPVGKHRAFPIQGDSMLPVRSGSYVVARFLESYDEVKDGRTYILLTSTEGIVYKRAYNRVEKDGTLHLHSDNKLYAPYKVQIEDVLELWEFTCLIDTQEYSDDELNLSSIMNMLRDLKVELAALKQVK